MYSTTGTFYSILKYGVVRAYNDFLKKCMISINNKDWGYMLIIQCTCSPLKPTRNPPLKNSKEFASIYNPFPSCHCLILRTSLWHWSCPTRLRAHRAYRQRFRRHTEFFREHSRMLSLREWKTWWPFPKPQSVRVWDKACMKRISSWRCISSLAYQVAKVESTFSAGGWAAVGSSGSCVGGDFRQLCTDLLHIISALSEGCAIAVSSSGSIFHVDGSETKSDFDFSEVLILWKRYNFVSMVMALRDIAYVCSIS